MINGICHTGISTKNMEQSLWFYGELLGGRLILEVEEPKGTPWIKTLQYADGTCVELFYPRPEFPVGKDLGRNHFCFAVSDIEQLEKKLSEHEIDIIQHLKTARDGNKQFWCLDPNGYQIEFVEFSPGCPQLVEGPAVTLS